MTRAPHAASPARAVGLDWDTTRLHLVTGKGGTGKTTVASALALALASRGQRVLLCEVEGRQGLARLFDTDPLGYQETPIAHAAGGTELMAIAIDAEEALLEYLDMFYHLGRAGRALRKVGAIEFTTTIAPGLRDVLLIGKAYEAVRRRSGTHHEYDAVVVDAPPTGRIGHFLNVNSEVAGLAKVGPIKAHAESIMALLRSERAAIHVVTLLEDMPVQETCDAVHELTRLGLPVGAIVVNMVREPLLDAAQVTLAAKRALDPAPVRSGLAAAGLSADPALVAELLDGAAEHALRLQTERRQQRLLRQLGRPLFELPFVVDGVDVGAVFDLAEALDRQVPA